MVSLQGGPPSDSKDFADISALSKVLPVVLVENDTGSNIDIGQTPDKYHDEFDGFCQGDIIEFGEWVSIFLSTLIGVLFIISLPLNTYTIYIIMSKRNTGHNSHRSHMDYGQGYFDKIFSCSCHEFMCGVIT